MPKVTNKSLSMTVECEGGAKLREVAMHNLESFGCEMEFAQLV